MKNRDISKSWEEKLAIKVAKKLSKKSDRFVWLKKIEKDVKLGRVTKLNTKSEHKRHKERIAEISKLTKMRDERAAAKARKEEEMMMLQRQRVSAEADAEEKKECEFILDQCKAKSRIRFHEGRAKPIDILTLCYDGYNHEPCRVFEGLMVKDVEELRGEIQERLECLYRVVDDDDRRSMVEFWEALMVVCEWELAECKREKESGCGGGVHPSVETDVRSFLQGIQSYDELVALEARIESDMREGKSKVVEFWEAVLRKIHVYKARAFLKEFHHKHNKLHQCSKSKEENIQEDYKDKEEEDDFESRAKKVMGGGLEEGESVLGAEAEVGLDSQSCWWHDIYRPRKPKYFVKYHTGYVWNQYNRTHYDKENPPPKFIQGYKFNIFYPHLIDPTKTPQCFVDNDGDSDDTRILRFHGGPPYEDIAFRIPNKDWEYSRKKGFKCAFEDGVLRVYFNFKRLHYRR